MSIRGKFIVIEGIDGSGKKIQTRLLKEKLKTTGLKLLDADFPRYYESKWGELVGKLLIGEFGKMEEVSPYLAVLPYMLDQYTWSRDIGKPWMQKGGWILSNRYFTSNVHQVAKLNTASQKKYRDWLWPMGYKQLGLLKPDIVVFVDTRPSVARKLNLNKKLRTYLKKRKRDLAETNWEHQRAAYREYKRMVKNDKSWIRVSGVRKVDEDYRSKIHNDIWAIIKRLL